MTDPVLTKKQMAELAEFFQYSRPARAPCKLGFAKAQLDDAEEALLDRALAQSTNIITAASIVKWLEKRGHDSVTFASIISHRARKCSCYDAA